MTKPLRKACLVVDAPYANDRIFHLEDRALNRDDCLYFFSAFRTALAEKGYHLRTQDQHRPEDSELIVFNEAPREKDRAAYSDQMLKRSVLMLFESELIRPDNWDLNFHKRVRVVVTWSDSHVHAGDGRYIKGGFAHRIPDRIATRAFPDRRICALISGNKSVRHPLELYSARRTAIDWFECHAASDFQYFGFGWERPYLSGGFATRVLRRLDLLRHLPVRPSKCFGGAVGSKLDTLSGFRFSICFENARNIDGYITEKIFDSFFAGCVPVYWGAGNITSWVPAECFIDFRQFLDSDGSANDSSFRKLRTFLHAYSKTDWEQWRLAVEQFLRSDRASIFNADVLAPKLADDIGTVFMPANLEAQA